MSLHINHVDFEAVTKSNKKMTVKEKKKAGEEKRKLSRGQKKFLKRQEELQSELKATEAAERRETKVRYHTEIIQQVFLVYFRILKHKKGKQIIYFFFWRIICQRFSSSRLRVAKSVLFVCSLCH